MNKAGSGKNATSRSSMININANPKKQNFRIELAAIVVIILLAFAYSYYRVGKTLEFSPQKLYEKTFVEPVESIRDLQGSSKATVGYDSWIRFNCPTGATLRNAKEFKSYIGEAGRSSCEAKYPDDKGLKQTVDSYEYFVRSESATSSIVNESLLVNKKTHDYYYHISGL